MFDIKVKKEVLNSLGIICFTKSSEKPKISLIIDNLSIDKLFYIYDNNKLNVEARDHLLFLIESKVEKKGSSNYGKCFDWRECFGKTEYLGNSWHLCLGKIFKYMKMDPDSHICRLEEFIEPIIGSSSEAEKMVIDFIKSCNIWPTILLRLIIMVKNKTPCLNYLIDVLVSRFNKFIFTVRKIIRENGEVETITAGERWLVLALEEYTVYRNSGYWDFLKNLILAKIDFNSNKNDFLRVCNAKFCICDNNVEFFKLLVKRFFVSIDERLFVLYHYEKMYNNEEKVTEITQLMEIVKIDRHKKELLEIINQLPLVKALIVGNSFSSFVVGFCRNLNISFLSLSLLIFVYTSMRYDDLKEKRKEIFKEIIEREPNLEDLIHMLCIGLKKSFPFEELEIILNKIIVSNISFDQFTDICKNFIINSVWEGSLDECQIKEFQQKLFSRIH